VRLAVAGTSTALAEVATPWLQEAGHEIVDVERPLRVSSDVDGLAAAMRGCDAVLHLTGTPARLESRWRRPGRRQDARRSDRVHRLARAAEVSGVRHVVAASSSLLYADQGTDWITERSPVCVTGATEPASIGELVVQRFADAPCRSGVVLRAGLLLGDSSLTRWSLLAAERGQPVGLGDPDGFMHVLHSDDLGPAILAALTVGSGTYNVGAEPVRRSGLLGALARAVGRPRCELLGPLRGWWAGPLAEPLGRSLRVSSAAFGAGTGWSPRHESVTSGWFEQPGQRHRPNVP
jgi:nucleoside-diphosphate-sugar epimerase